MGEGTKEGENKGRRKERMDEMKERRNKGGRNKGGREQRKEGIREGRNKEGRE